MNKLKLLMYLIVLTIISFNFSFSEEKRTIPSVKVKNLKGETIDTKSFSNDGKPFVICFWATWCSPCIIEQNTFNEVYDMWQEETGVKIISISIDDTRSSKKVAPFVKGRKWKFEFYLDENSNFKRAMNAGHPPHSFLVNGNGEIVWEHSGFAPGDEEELYAEIKKLINNNSEDSNSK
jgi:peroxiredoxin